MIMRTYTICSPLSIPIYAGKAFALNLNIYRNAHPYNLNKAKVAYKELITPVIQEIPPLQKVHITYSVYLGTRRKFDVSNICSVVDKFFCDALTALGIIPEDNFEHVPQVVYRYGGYDKENPRVEIIIEERS